MRSNAPVQLGREGRQATPGAPPSTETFATGVVSCAEACAIAVMPKTAVAGSPNKMGQPEAVCIPLDSRFLVCTSVVRHSMHHFLFFPPKSHGAFLNAAVS